MKEMTDEEAEYWDEYYTKNPPKVDPSKARHVSRMVAIDDLSADYLLSISAASRKTPSQIVNELVHERIAVAV